MKTGIDALDLLLFGDRNSLRNTRRGENGFRPGDVVLIRGEPGSGKTTLALQISAAFIRANPTDFVQYMTLEEPDESMRARCERFNFPSDDINWIGRKAVEEQAKTIILEESKIKPTPGRKAKVAAQVASTATRVASQLKPEVALLKAAGAV